MGAEQTGQDNAQWNAPTSGMAILSLVCGLSGILTCGVTAVFGVILGIVGLIMITHSQGALKGKWLAISGLAVSTVIVAGWFWLLAPARAPYPPDPQRGCMSNLRNMGLGLVLYKLDYDDELPAALNDIWPYVPDEKLFVCPADKDPIVIGQVDGQDLKSSYRYVGRIHPPDRPDAVIVLYEREPFHKERRGVCFFDYHAESILEEDFLDHLQDGLELVKKQWDEYSPDQRQAIEDFYSDRLGR